MSNRAFEEEVRLRETEREGKIQKFGMKWNTQIKLSSDFKTTAKMEDEKLNVCINLI